jgi:condensation domain-containing protein
VETLNDMIQHAEPAPLMATQRLLRREGGTSTVELPYRVEGPLDVDAFVEALASLVDRHDALRLAFCDCTGDTHQWARESPAWSDLLDCRDVTAATDEQFVRYARQVATRDTLAPWDLASELPFRFRLLRRSPHVHAFLATFAQVAVDGGVRSILGGELWQAYAAAVTDMDPPGRNWQAFPPPAGWGRAARPNR